MFRKSLRRNGAAKKIRPKRCKMVQKKCKNGLCDLGRCRFPQKQTKETKKRGWNREIHEISERPNTGIVAFPQQPPGF